MLMKIGQYSDSFLPIVDGVGRVVLSYAETLGQMGHSCYVFAPMADMGYLGNYHFQVIDYNTLQMPGKMPYRVGLPQLDARFERRVKHTKLDIVHVHAPFMLGFSGLHLAKKRGLPLVGTFHSKYYDDFRSVLKVDSLARLGVKQVVDFYNQCDEVWAVSETSAETLKSYGFTREVTVMENGTDVRPLDETVLPELRTRFSLMEDVPMLLYVGQMNWKKNLLRTLEAAALLRSRGMRFHVLLAGQGPHLKEIEKKTAELGMEDCVTFTGHITTTRELDGLYALADLFIFPSLYDNAPMVLREAAAMGTPAVLISGSNAAEYVHHGQNGITCEDDTISLAEAITTALSDRSLLAQMGQAARETIPIPWTVLMKRVEARYAALIDRVSQSASFPSSME